MRKYAKMKLQWPAKLYSFFLYLTTLPQVCNNPVLKKPPNKSFLFLFWKLIVFEKKNIFREEYSGTYR